MTDETATVDAANRMIKTLQNQRNQAMDAIVQLENAIGLLQGQLEQAQTALKASEQKVAELSTVEIRKRTKVQ